MEEHTTGQPVLPSPTPALSLPESNGEGKHGRCVDLGREDHLVTWGEWFSRSFAVMSSVMPDEFKGLLRFRVSLEDHRQFLIREVRQHVARGRCTLQKTRWHERDAVCDVITGYLLIGNDELGIPTTLAVLPEQIDSVECVLVAVPRPPGMERPDNGKRDPDETIPFGFARFAQALEERPPGIEEVDEEDRSGEGPM